MEKILSKFSSKEKTNIIIEMLVSLHYDQLLDILPYFDRVKLTSEFWEEMLSSYNNKYYVAIVENNSNIDYEGLYLDLLEAELDYKTLDNFIFNGIYSTKLDKYEYIKSLDMHVKTELNDVPVELFVSMTKDLDYKDIISLCSVDKSLSILCLNKSNWKLIFKEKYSSTFEYLVKNKLDIDLDYEDMVKELDLAISSLEEIEDAFVYACGEDLFWLAHGIIENTDINVTDNDSILWLCANGYVDALKYLVENKKVDVTFNNSESVLAAAENGFLEVIKYLVENTNVDVTANNNESVRCANSNGYSDVVEYLLKNTNAKL